MDESIFNRIFSAAAGVWAMVAMAAVALFKAWPNIMARINEGRRDSASEKSDDWRRIRDERDHAQQLAAERLQELIECHNSKVEWMTRAIQAEATLQGYGIARQQVAVEDAVERIVTAERIADHSKKTDRSEK